MFSLPIAVVGGRLLLIHMCGYFCSASKIKKGLKIFQCRMPNRSWRIIYSFLWTHFFSLYCKHRINAFNWVPGIWFINNKVIAKDIKEIINVSTLTHLNLAGNSTITLPFWLCVLQACFLTILKYWYVRETVFFTGCLTVLYQHCILRVDSTSDISYKKIGWTRCHWGDTWL